MRLLLIQFNEILHENSARTHNGEIVSGHATVQLGSIPLFLEQYHAPGDSPT